MVDRAGAVPDDGVTHQGIFDIALLRPVPGLKLLSPSTQSDLTACFEYALKDTGAVIIRYPKLSCPPDIPKFEQTVEEGIGVFVSQEELLFTQKKSVPVERNERILIVSTGGLYTEVKAAAEKCAEKNIITDLYMLRFIKPLDEEYFISLAKNYRGVLFAEDGVKIGGVSEYLEELLNKNNYGNTKILAFGDRYYEHGTRAEILEAAGISVECIEKAVLELKK